MAEIDAFALELFEEAKRFYERAKEAESRDGEIAYLHAALLLGISSFEAHINAIADEMSERPKLDLLDRSILLEKDFRFENNNFRLLDKLKMYNLLDRYKFIYAKFSLPNKKLDTSSSWWGKLVEGIKLRNEIVHPKENKIININNVESALLGIIDALDEIYMALYGNHFPALNRNLDSRKCF
jgi:hypothetical protein